jgi:3-oxoacyl-[acyl-carrier-protein] synthase-3
MYAHITGWGKALPEKRLTNADLEKMVETADDWIVSRTGIRERRIVSEGETTDSLGADAARDALRVAKVAAQDVEMVIAASCTPEALFPSIANRIQERLELKGAAALDLNQACAGFIHALAVARGFIASGQYQTILVVGSEVLTRHIDWSDRTTCVLFGDAAGAVVVQASGEPGGPLAFDLGSDGNGGDLLMLPTDGTLFMNGREVYRFAVNAMTSSLNAAIQKADLTLDHIDLLIPHQANIRIIQSAAQTLKLPLERVFTNVEKYGNTSAASIPVALCEAIEGGRVKSGDTIAMVAFGAGLAWGATVVRWTNSG